MSDHYDRYNGMENLVGTDSARTVKGFPIDADLLMLKAEEEYGFRTRDRLYELIRTMPKYELPSVQPKRGKWVPIKPDNPWHVNDVYRCDQCGNFLDFYGVNAGRGDANYCPNCGAKMEMMG